MFCMYSKCLYSCRGGRWIQNSNEHPEQWSIWHGRSSWWHNEVPRRESGEICNHTIGLIVDWTWGHIRCPVPHCVLKNTHLLARYTNGIVLGMPHTHTAYMCVVSGFVDRWRQAVGVSWPYQRKVQFVRVRTSLSLVSLPLSLYVCVCATRCSYWHTSCPVPLELAFGTSSPVPLDAATDTPVARCH